VGVGEGVGVGTSVGEGGGVGGVWYRRLLCMFSQNIPMYTLTHN